MRTQRIAASGMTRRFVLLLVAALAVLTVTVTRADEARAAEQCSPGTVCLYDGSSYGGIMKWFDDYDAMGMWRALPSGFADQPRSALGLQFPDRCGNANGTDADPYVYFADSGPSGKVGALFMAQELSKWPSLGYYNDRIDVRYNRCVWFNSDMPRYTPKNAF